MSPMVTVKLQSAPLIDALNSLLTQDADIVIANEAELKGKTVTISVKDRPVEEALDTMLKPNNIAWYRDKNGTYIVNASRPVDLLPSSLMSSVLPPAPELNPLRQFLITEKIELRHISPEDALFALGLPSSGYDRRTLNSQPTYEVQDWRDLSTTIGGNTGLRPSNPNVMMGPNGTGAEAILPSPANLPNNNGFNRAPDERDQFAQAGRRPGFTPNPNVPRPPGVPGTPGQPGTTGQAAGTTGQNVRGFLPPGIELVAGLMTDNSLMVLGPPDDIDELRSTIRLLDVAPPQVSIKVDVITTTTSAVRQFGANYEFFSRAATVGATAGPVPSSGLSIDVIRGNLQAVIGALTTNGRGRVISSPIVTTQNNSPATISQNTTIPVFVPRILQSQGGIVTVTDVVGVQATTGLQVIPRVNRDGTITVSGSVVVQNITRIVSSPDGSSFAPEVNGTQLENFNRRVLSGETLVIGGLNTKQESDQENRVPLLADIPLIGRLFRSRNRSNTDTQLLIFLTPQVVGERAATSELPP
ncbi:MAG: hypothetical protein KY468_15195 [Armatimonadetes bacterium]|nr:hypothetical protein [Armatimonadota bacterium]